MGNRLQTKSQHESIRRKLELVSNELVRAADERVVRPVNMVKKYNFRSHPGASTGNWRANDRHNVEFGLSCEPWWHYVIRESTGYLSMDSC